VHLFTNDDVCGLLAEVITQQKEIHRYRLLAYVFMPDHVHLILVPTLEDRIGSLIGSIKRFSARHIHTLLKAKGRCVPSSLYVQRQGRSEFSLWQPRCFDHNCRSVESIREKIDYCHYNPVSRGLVKDPADWKWSSYNVYSSAQEGPLGIDEFDSLGGLSL